MADRPGKNLVLEARPIIPGEVLACCGAFELLTAVVRGRSLEAWWDPLPDDQGRQPAKFVIDGADYSDLVAAIKELKLGADGHSSATTQNHEESGKKKKKYDPPVALKLSRADLICLDWWNGDNGYSDLKTYGANVTPRGLMVGPGGKGCLNRAQKKLADIEKEGLGQMRWCLGRKVFGEKEATFGLSPENATVTPRLGFSLQDVEMEVPSAPFTDLLGAIGLQGFRPNKRSAQRNRGPGGWLSCWSYRLWQEPLPIAVARAAFSCRVPFVDGPEFEFGIIPAGDDSKFKMFGYARRRRM